MTPSRQNRGALPRLAPVMSALVHAGVLGMASSLTAHAAVLAVPEWPQQAASPMLYIAQSTQDYSKYPGAAPPPAPPVPAAPGQAGSRAPVSAPGAASVPVKPAPQRDSRDSSR